MRVKTMTSAVLLAISGAAIAQVGTAPEPKLGNTTNGQDAGNGNAASNGIAANTADPGKS